MAEGNYSFMQNRKCEYFPCHKVKDDSEFNCLFCYCPLYTLGDKCGGNFSYTEKGIKNCTDCLLPHSRGGYDYVISRFPQISALATDNRKSFKLTLIRHGKTPGNERGAYIGRTDEELSEKGIAEVKARKRDFEDRKISLAFVSPMKRCLQTARLLREDLDYQIIDEFKEMDFGIFEGLNYKDLENSLEYKKWVDSNCTSPIPEGECRAQFTEGVMKGFDKVLSQVIECPSVEEVLLVVHGGTIMSIMSELTNCDYYAYHVDNACAISFDCVYKEGKLFIAKESLS